MLKRAHFQKLCNWGLSWNLFHVGTISQFIFFLFISLPVHSLRPFHFIVFTSGSLCNAWRPWTKRSNCKNAHSCFPAGNKHDQDMTSRNRQPNVVGAFLVIVCFRNASSHSSLKLVCSLWFWHWLDCQMLTQIARHWSLQNGFVLHSKWSVAFWCVCTHCVKRKFGCKLVWHPCCLWIYLDCNTVIYFCCTVEVCDFNFLIDLPR